LTPQAAPLYVSKDASEEDFRFALAHVPEVDLEPAGKPEDMSARQAAQKLQERAGAIKAHAKEGVDAFIQHLEETRSDLAGLPFLKGKACSLGAAQAKTWGELSRLIRTALATSDRLRGSLARSAASSPPSYPNPEGFWQQLSLKRVQPLLQKEEALPALQQLLDAEHQGMRLSLVRHLAKVKGPAASAGLARRALFDLDPEVRKAALAALSRRPAREYSGVLLQGVRYPWVLVVQRATEAIVALKLKDEVPRLVAFLDEPDPDTPFLARVKGKEVPMVRELVRINHLRNCFLCHAPSDGTSEAVRGPVPVPGRPLPSGADVYYAERSGVAFVRADITYLRQDFSVMQPVSDNGKWPLYQRYDFLVRTRPLTSAERVVWDNRKTQAEGAPLSEHKQAVLFALRELTGKDAGTAGAQWRALLHEVGAARGVGGDAAWPFWWKRQGAK
jgi:hypothetical protein